jgi:hypothetical protein
VSATLEKTQVCAQECGEVVGFATNLGRRIIGP